MNDKASFDRQAVEEIFGTYPLSLMRAHVVADDLHHVVGRGHEFGAGPKHEHRKLFSSVYGCCPIDRQSHDKEALRDFDLRCFLLDSIREIVDLAVADHRYTLTDIDYQFLRFLALWRADPHGHKLLLRL